MWSSHVNVRMVCLFICVLFDSDVSSSDYVTSDDEINYY